MTWLDAFFSEGSYDHGNEPDILAPWLYIHAGRPDRTAAQVRAIMRRSYNSGRSGLPGNDDAGTLSSWYVWSAIGLFPNAGRPFYYIGSPVFARSTIHLEHHKRFVISAGNASGANIYILSARLNGQPLNRAWLTHDEVVGGGSLDLQMGSHPSHWAEDAPPLPMG